MRLVFVVLMGCASAFGCVQALGLQDWTDPPGSGGAAGSTASATAASVGGASASTGARSSSASGGVDDAGNATCADGVQNGLETDVDCGGDACPPCALERQCGGDADCQSGACRAGVCAALGGGSPCQSGLDPTCHDCVRNGPETDVDCGGDACLPCGAGKGCISDGDCTSAYCAQGTCAMGAPGKPCRAAGDCASQHCSAGACWTGACCQ